ncbi:MAG: NHL repeat-containing protein, partial [Thermodesulfobacteriota bacterium]|nr:NHL repeat-containing protein [Thermodesulfobacteriota bacterium]
LIYTSDFFPLFTLNKDDGILSPTCMTLDPEGYLFVGQSTSYNHPRARISIFNPCLKWKKDIHFEGFEGAEKFVPKNIALDKEGKIYVAGTNHVGIIILDKQSGFLSSIKPVDEFMGTKTKVTIVDVEIDRNGKIYLLSEERGRVYVYDTRGEFLFKFGEKGGSSGKLSRPRGITVDTLRDAIYIIDYMRHAANVYSATSGEFLFEFGGKGWGKGWFQFPSDICVNREGQVLVADTFNDRIQVFELK